MFSFYHVFRSASQNDRHRIRQQQRQHRPVLLLASAPASATRWPLPPACHSSSSTPHEPPSPPPGARRGVCQQQNLIAITVRTIRLLHRNRALQAKLEQLKAETTRFVSDVMANRTLMTANAERSICCANCMTSDSSGR